MEKEVKKKDLKEKEEVIDEKEKKKQLKESKKIRFKQNRQIFWIIFLMIALILIVAGVPFIIENYVNQFEHINLDFQKTRLGKIDFYSTRIPIADQFDNILGTYSMNFRSNPRKLDFIKVDVPKNLVTFKNEEPVFISLDPEMEPCEDNSIGLINLAGFLRDFGNFNVSSSFTDKDYSYTEGYFFRDCDNTYGGTVIEIRSGEESKIEIINSGCYRLTYKDCEIIPVTERFILIILEKYMTYFMKV